MHNQKDIELFFTELRELLETSPVPFRGMVQIMREYRSLQCSYLAQLMGIDAASFSYFQSQERMGRGKLSTLEKFADLIDCDLVYFFVPRNGEDPLLEVYSEEDDNQDIVPN